MDQYYVTPDGQIAALPRRSFFDRLTSGLYDASVEWRRPGGGQEARLARTQPLTSALNQFGSQKRTFDQENEMLRKQQEFNAGQNALQRDDAWSRMDFEAGVRKEADRLKREQDAAQFAATHGLAQDAENRLMLGQNLKGWDTAKQFMMEQPKIDAQIEADKARAAASLAEAKLHEAQLTSALQEQEMVTPGLAEAFAALQPKLLPNPGVLTNLTRGDLYKMNLRPPGTSGQMMDPAIIERLLGGGGMPKAGPQISTVPGTNAPAVIDLNQLRNKRQ